MPRFLARFGPFTVLLFSLIPAFDPASAQAASVRYVLNPEASSLQFDARSTLHPFSGDARVLSGELNWDAAAKTLGEGAVIRVPVTGIATGERARDQEMCRMFGVKDFPDIEFKATSVTALDAERYRLEGTLKIRQIERPVTMEVTARESADGSVEVTGETQVLTTSYELKPPVVMGLIRVLPEVKIRFKSVWKPV